MTVDGIIEKVTEDLKMLLGVDKIETNYIPYVGLYIKAGARKDVNWESDYFRFNLCIEGLSEGFHKNSDKLRIVYKESAVRQIPDTYGYLYKDHRVGTTKQNTTIGKVCSAILFRATNILEQCELRSEFLFMGYLKEETKIPLMNQPSKLW